MWPLPESVGTDRLTSNSWKSKYYIPKTPGCVHACVCVFNIGLSDVVKPQTATNQCWNIKL